MRRLFIGLSIVSGIGVKAQQPIPKEIRVKEVTVYMQGAKVYGNMPVTLQKGKNFIKVINLPNDLDERTYKIHLDKGTTLLSITPQTNHLKEQQLTEAEINFNQQKKSLQRAISLLDIQIRNLSGEQTLINNNLQIAANETTTPQEQLVKLSAFYRKRMLEIDNQTFLLNEQKMVLNDSVTTIDQQLQTFKIPKTQNRKELVLEILAARESNINLGVSYIVSNAGWIPTYDIRATSINKPLEMVYKGQIYQHTGQDWTNIQLYVSTYKPSYDQNRPILHPLYVAEYTAHNGLKDVYKEKSNSTAMSNTYQMRVTDESAISLPTTSISYQQLNILYELKYQQTIYSQEKEQYVILDQKEVMAEYKYHAVPKISNQVFLMAFVKNWHSMDLVSGTANIFFEDNYIGKTHIQSDYLKDEFPISLGTDERIIMKRTKVEDKTTTKTLNTNQWATTTYQISIRNNTKDTIELEVLDQVPISENNKITVKALDIGNGSFDEKTGSILWNRTISSGSTDRITYAYEVKYPKEMNIRYYNR